MITKAERFLIWLSPGLARVYGVVTEEEEERRKKKKEEQEAEYRQELAEAKAEERTRNLCILSGACLTAMTTAGLWSFAVDREAIEMAEGMLDRIERGPEPEAKEEAQP